MHYGRTMTMAFLVAALASPALARENVTTIKPLLIKALRVGKAEGKLVSRDAQAFSQQFGTSAPILVDVEQVGTHKEQGCGRLRVVTRQAGVIERDTQGTPRPAAEQFLAWQVNYCLSGRFPIGEGGEGDR